MKRKGYITLFTVVIFSLIIIGKISIASGESPDRIDIENMAKNFVQHSQSFHKLPDNKLNSEEIDDATIKDISKNKKNELNKFMKPGSPIYQKNESIIENAMNQQKKKDIRSFGGKATDINIVDTTINDNSASIKLTYTAHATYGKWQNGKWSMAEPTNRIIEKIDFNKENGKWYIVNDTWEFEPGSEP